MNHQATYIGTETIEMIEDDQIDGMTDDDDDDVPSSGESAYDGDLMHDDEVTAQLAAAGPVGVAAAAAIASAKKRKRPHSFETNPSIRKRQQNRLLRKLRVSPHMKFWFIRTESFLCVISFLSIFLFIANHL